MLVAGSGSSWYWLLVIPAVLLQTMFNIGAALIVARLGGRLADVSELIPFFLRISRYFCGVMYLIITLPATLITPDEKILSLNPPGRLHLPHPRRVHADLPDQLGRQPAVQRRAVQRVPQSPGRVTSPGPRPGSPMPAGLLPRHRHQQRPVDRGRRAGASCSSYSASSSSGTPRTSTAAANPALPPAAPAHPPSCRRLRLPAVRRRASAPRRLPAPSPAHAPYSTRTHVMLPSGDGQAPASHLAGLASRRAPHVR